MKPLSHRVGELLGAHLGIMMFLTGALYLLSGGADFPAPVWIAIVMAATALVLTSSEASKDEEDRKHEQALQQALRKHNV